MAKPARDALSRREREIMNALFRLGNRATAEEIRAQLAEPPSGSSCGEVAEWLKATVC